jgi:phosphoglycolate phosphatase-like HAD superfamily hydrolase
MRHTLLLFDVDGTLLLTGGAGIRAMQTTGHRLFGPAFDMARVATAGMLDTIIYRDLIQRCQLTVEDHHADAFCDAYVAELAAEIDRTRASVRLLPGIASLIDTLRQRERERGDVMLGLLTGNYTKAIPVKFAAVGLDPAWFTIHAFAEHGPDRPSLTRHALNTYHQHTGHPARPDRTIVIGDTPRDIDCAKAHACLAFAVATGPYSRQELLAHGADVAVDDLTDPAPLLNLLD